MSPNRNLDGVSVFSLKSQAITTSEPSFWVKKGHGKVGHTHKCDWNLEVSTKVSQVSLCDKRIFEVTTSFFIIIVLPSLTKPEIQSQSQGKQVDKKFKIPRIMKRTSFQSQGSNPLKDLKMHFWLPLRTIKSILTKRSICSNKSTLGNKKGLQETEITYIDYSMSLIKLRMRFVNKKILLEITLQQRSLCFLPTTNGLFWDTLWRSFASFSRFQQATGIDFQGQRRSSRCLNWNGKLELTQSQCEKSSSRPQKILNKKASLKLNLPWALSNLLSISNVKSINAPIRSLASKWTLWSFSKALSYDGWSRRT